MATDGIMHCAAVLVRIIARSYFADQIANQYFSHLMFMIVFLYTLFLQPPEVCIEDEEWYYGSIDRREAEGKCRNTGDYIVRFSDRQNKYVLSVLWNSAGRHFVIQEVPDVSHTLKPYPSTFLGDVSYGSCMLCASSAYLSCSLCFSLAEQDRGTAVQI